MGECRLASAVTENTMRRFPIRLAMYNTEEKRKRRIWIAHELESPRNTNSDTQEWLAPSIAWRAMLSLTSPEKDSKKKIKLWGSS
jgi:hypothetical protein